MYVPMSIVDSKDALDTLIVQPPFISYVQAENAYYIRVRGGFAGILTDQGKLEGRSADKWQKLDFAQYVIKVSKYIDLQKHLANTPPLIAFVQETHRYYALVGPEGYGGSTGFTQKRDGSGNLLFEGSGHITGTVVISGENSFNTVFVTESTDIPVGSYFTAAGITDANGTLRRFKIVTRTTTQNGIKWEYTPAFDLQGALFVGATFTIANVGTATLKERPTVAASTVNVCTVEGLTGTVLVSNIFNVNDPWCPGDFTIVQIAGNVWTYTPASPYAFAHASTITMKAEGNPIVDARGPNTWVCLTHLFDDNSGVI